MRIHREIYLHSIRMSVQCIRTSVQCIQAKTTWLPTLVLVLCICTALFGYNRKMKFGLFSYFSPKTYRYVEGAQKMRQLFKLPQHEQQVASLSTLKLYLRSLYNTYNIDFDQKIAKITLKVPITTNVVVCWNVLEASLTNSMDPDQTSLHINKQHRLRWACASVQSHQILCCLNTQNIQ